MAEITKKRYKIEFHEKIGRKVGNFPKLAKTGVFSTGIFGSVHIF